MQPTDTTIPNSAHGSMSFGIQIYVYLISSSNNSCMIGKVDEVNIWDANGLTYYFPMALLGGYSSYANARRRHRQNFRRGFASQLKFLFWKEDLLLKGFEST